MSRYGTYDLKYGFIPDDDCPQQETPKQTNLDRIRAMTVEELAEFLTEYRCVYKAPHCMDTNCTQCWLNWLKQGVNDGD